jgi:hypothetical protein
MKSPKSKKEEKKNDYRQNHPFAIRAIKQNKTIFLNDLEIYKIKKTRVEFSTPNIISMFINISHKSFIESTSIYRKLIEPKLIDGKTAEFKEDELTKLYDYLEAVKVSVIFAYNSIEAFVNIAIPDDYTYENKNNRGIKETWDKEAIQRWMTTSEKLVKILPELRKLDNPKNEKFWSNFKNLEQLRNDIIHPKSASKELNTSNEIHKKFFDENVFKWIQSTGDVLRFYCQGEYSERYFPMGFGPRKIKPAELDDFDNYFEEVK